MPKGTQYQGNFTSGELSPSLAGRPDVQIFTSGAQEITNFTVRPQGGLFRRHGFEFISPIADMTKAGRLIRFEFSDTQAYVLEMGDSIFRVIKDGAMVVDTTTTQTITGISSADPAVVTFSGAHGFIVGDRVIISGGDMTEIDNREFQVKAIGGGPPHTITLEHPHGPTDINASNYTTWTAGGTVSKVLEVTTPWPTADLAKLSWAQSANVMFATHPDYAPREITRTSDTVWTVTEFGNKDGPYKAENEDTSITMELTVKFGGRAVALSATEASPGVITIAPTTSAAYFRNTIAGVAVFADNDRVYIDGAAGGTWSTLNKVFYLIDNATATTFSLINESTGVAVNTTGLGTLTAAVMNICHADTTADAVDTSGNTFFTAAEVHSVFEYRDENIWTLAMQMDSPGSPSDTAKVQVMSHMTKLDIPQTAEVFPFRRDNEATGITTTFSDVFDQEDVSLLVRGTGLQHWDGSVLNITVSASGGQGPWAFIESVTDGSTILARREQHTQWEDGATLGLQRYHARSYESGFGSGENFIVLKNKVTTGRIEASSAQFASTDVGRWIKLRYSETIVNFEITEFLSTTQVRGTLDILPKVVLPSRANASQRASIAHSVLKLPLEDGGATTKWSLGAWHGALTDSVKNYPRLCVFHEQRLVFAATQDNPDTIWMSRPNDFNKFALQDANSVVTDSHAIQVTVGSSEVNPVIWMASGKTMFMGTLDRAYVIKASDGRQALTPTNISIESQSAIGAQPDVRPVVTNEAAFFLQRGGRNLREMTFDFNQEGYVAKDMNALSDHILTERQPLVSSVSADTLEIKLGQHPLLMALTTTGDIGVMAYEPEQQVQAWSLFQYYDGNTNIEDIVTVANGIGDWDIYVILIRIAGAGTVRYIERLRLLQSSGSDRDTFVDSFRFADVSSSAGVALGLEHLEGDSVRVMNGGVDKNGDDTATVSSGEVAYDNTAGGNTVVGLTFTSKVQTMPIEAGSAEGFAQGKTRRLDLLQLVLLKSQNYEFSGDDVDADYKEDLFGLTPTAGTMNTFEGIKTLPPAGTFRHDRNPSIFIRQKRPYPLNILAITGRMKTTK